MDLILTFKRNWIPLFLFLCLNQTLQAKIEADFFSPELGKSYQLPDGLFQVIHLDNEKTGNGLLTLKTLGEIYLVSFENLLLDKNDRIVQGRIISAAPNHLFNPLTPEDLTRWKLKLTMEGELPTLLNHWVGTKDVDLNGNHLFLSSFELTVDGLFTNLLFINETPEDQLLIFEKQNVPFGFHGPDWCSLVMDLQSPTITNDPAFPITILKDSSYVSFNCNGFVEFSLTCQHTLNATHFLPVPPNGIGPIALFKVVAKSFNNFIGTVRVDPFRIKGISGVSFSVIDATVDYSSENNPSFSNILDCNGITVTKDPTWRGFFLKKLILTLDDLNSFSVSGENILLDGNGFSGQIVVNPNYNEKDKGWAFVLSSLSLKFNNFIPCGTLDILGYFKTPVSPDSMTYSVTLSKEGLNFIVKAEGEYRIPFLGENSKMILGSGSRAGLTINKDGFKPSFSFNGEFKISTGNFEFPALGFEGFQMDGRNSSLGGFDNINFTAFSFGGIRFNPGKTPEPPSGSSTTSPTTPPKVANYPFTLDNLEFKNNNSRIGLEFEVKLNLAEEAFLATTIATIWSNINLNDFNLGFPSLEVNAVQIKADLGAVNIEGGVCFYDNGVNKGFMGKLNMGIPSLSLKISSEAIFGNIINEYRYFYVAAGFENYSSTLGAPLAIYGFNGGFYYNMVNESSGKSKISQKDTFDSCNVGIDGNYKPREGAWGLTAGLIMGMIGVPQTLAADVTLTIAKTSAAGSFLVALAGDAYIMNAGIENRKNAMITFCINLKYVYNDNQRGLFGSLGGMVNMNPIMTATVNKECTTDNIVFGSVYNNTEGKWVDKLYFFLGLPNGEKIDVDLLGMITAKSYFFAGTGFNPVDLELKSLSDILGGFGNDLEGFNGEGLNLDNLKALEQERNKERNPADLKGECAGLGFGLKFNIDIDANFIILFAQLKALAGFDLQFKKCTTNPSCSHATGWNVEGMGYSAVGASVSIGLDLGFIKGKFNILSAVVAAGLKTKFPEPFLMEGVLAGKYTVLGGLARGEFELPFQIKSEDQSSSTCIKGEPDLDFSKIEFIIDTKPKKDGSIEIYEDPTASFRFPMNKNIVFSLKNDQTANQTLQTSREIIISPSVSMMKLTKKSGTQVFEGTPKLADKLGYVYSVNLGEYFLDANSEYEFYIKLNFVVSKGREYILDGTFRDYIDTTLTFRTRSNPTKIIPELLETAQPANNQKYWMKNYAHTFLEFKKTGGNGSWTPCELFPNSWISNAVIYNKGLADYLCMDGATVNKRTELSNVENRPSVIEKPNRDMNFIGANILNSIQSSLKPRETSNIRKPVLVSSLSTRENIPSITIVNNTDPINSVFSTRSCNIPAKAQNGYNVTYTKNFKYILLLTNMETKKVTEIKVILPQFCDEKREISSLKENNIGGFTYRTWQEVRNPLDKHVIFPDLNNVDLEPNKIYSLKIIRKLDIDTIKLFQAISQNLILDKFEFKKEVNGSNKVSFRIDTAFVFSNLSGPDKKFMDDILSQMNYTLYENHYFSVSSYKNFDDKVQAIFNLKPVLSELNGATKSWNFDRSTDYLPITAYADPNYKLVVTNGQKFEPFDYWDLLRLDKNITFNSKSFINRQIFSNNFPWYHHFQKADFPQYLFNPYKLIREWQNVHWVLGFGWTCCHVWFKKESGITEYRDRLEGAANKDWGSIQGFLKMVINNEYFNESYRLDFYDEKNTRSNKDNPFTLEEKNAGVFHAKLNNYYIRDNYARYHKNIFDIYKFHANIASYFKDSRRTKTEVITTVPYKYNNIAGNNTDYDENRATPINLYLDNALKSFADFFKDRDIWNTLVGCDNNKLVLNIKYSKTGNIIPTYINDKIGQTNVWNRTLELNKYWSASFEANSSACPTNWDGEGNPEPISTTDESNHLKYGDWVQIEHANSKWNLYFDYGGKDDTRRQNFWASEDNGDFRTMFQILPTGINKLGDPIDPKQPIKLLAKFENKPKNKNKPSYEKYMISQTTNIEKDLFRVREWDREWDKIGWAVNEHFWTVEKFNEFPFLLNKETIRLKSIHNYYLAADEYITFNKKTKNEYTLKRVSAWKCSTGCDNDTYWNLIKVGRSGDSTNYNNN